MKYTITSGRVEWIEAAAAAGNKALILAELKAEVMAALCSARHDVYVVWSVGGTIDDFEALSKEWITLCDPKVY